MDVHPQNSILRALREHPEGLTITSIASISGLHRHTVTKYVKDLMRSGTIQERDVGMAKLCYLNRNRTVGLQLGSKAETGQVQIVIMMLFLLAIPVLIIAQTISNSTTITANLVEIFDTSTTAPSSNMIENTTDIAITTTSTVTTTAEMVVNSSYSAENSTVQDAIQGTIAESNVSYNETTTTAEITTTTSSTIPTTAETIDTGLITEENTEMNVTIETPEKITRGSNFVLKATVTNTFSTSKTIKIRWELPEGFSISPDKFYACSNVDSGNTCISEITVMTTSSTGLGKSQIRVVVDHD